MPHVQTHPASSVLAVSAMIFFGLAVVTHAADKPRHLFVLSGQSNMAGLNPAAGFLPELARLLPDADIVHVKVAKGGRPIRLWVAEWGAIAEASGIDAAGLPKGAGSAAPVLYQPVLDAARAELVRGPAPASVTFLWMQGERDAKEKLSAAYAAAMRQLIANLRRDLDRPDMGVVIGRLSDHLMNSEEWVAVRDAQVAVAVADPHGAWVDTDDCNNKGQGEKLRDDLHLTSPGYELFGRRLARQAVALIQGHAPAADGRPGEGE